MQTDTTPSPEDDDKLRARLEKQLANNTGKRGSAPGNRWTGSQPGDRIFGTVERLEEITSRKGDGSFLVCDIRCIDDNEVYSIPASRASLNEKLIGEGVTVGDLIAVQYEGTYVSSYGTEGHSYSLAVERVASKEPF